MKKWNMFYVDQAIGQFWKRLTSIIAVKCEMLNTVFKCSIWPPFTVMVDANRFQNWTIYVKRICSTFYVPQCTLLWTVGLSDCKSGLYATKCQKLLQNSPIPVWHWVI